MTITIIINGKKHKKQIPTSWEQVDFETFLKLNDCGQDIIRVIALITGVDYDILLKSKIIEFEDVIEQLAFLKYEPQPVIPKTILGYTVPKKLEYEETQMFVDLQNYIQQAGQLTGIDQLRQYCVLVAVYACKQKHGKYDWQLAESMQDEFLKAPCTEVMGIGHFTLLRLVGFLKNINLNSRRPITRTQKYKLVFRNWLKTLASDLRWFFWKRKLGLQKSK